jgi:hypothetical protein
VDQLVAWRAQGDEIFLRIVALPTPELGVVDLQIRHRPTGLAAPSVTPQHSFAELSVFIALPTNSRVFGAVRWQH